MISLKVNNVILAILIFISQRLSDHKCSDPSIPRTFSFTLVDGCSHHFIVPINYEQLYSNF